MFVSVDTVMAPWALAGRLDPAISRVNERTGARTLPLSRSSTDDSWVPPGENKSQNGIQKYVQYCLHHTAVQPTRVGQLSNSAQPGNFDPSPQAKGRRAGQDSRLGGHQASAPDWTQRQASHVTILIGPHLSASLAPNGQFGSCNPILGADQARSSSFPLNHSRAALQGAIFRAADGVLVQRTATLPLRPGQSGTTARSRIAMQISISGQ
jgi:hypothetical protein